MKLIMQARHKKSLGPMGSDFWPDKTIVVPPKNLSKLTPPMGRNQFSRFITASAWILAAGLPLLAAEAFKLFDPGVEL